MRTLTLVVAFVTLISTLGCGGSDGAEKSAGGGGSGGGGDGGGPEPPAALCEAPELVAIDVADQVVGDGTPES